MTDDPTRTTRDGDSDPATPTDRSFLRRVAGMSHREPPVTLAAGTLLDGTYRIERRIGAGGMGVVFLARDVKLDRDVALKLHLRADAERLEREARAIARLIHPSVVTVHEIGTWEGRVFVAMEYLDGGTARSWLDERRRPWPEILGFYLTAARGLAAAHRAGIVHRDFKPDNVLVGRDGRIRVADFGIAVSVAAGDDGVVAGTPAYMAPEQHQGAAGPAADQFAFAVALWEALHGERPFDGDTPAALAEASAAGRIRAPSSDRGVPRWIRRALERALAADPARRHPSMDALIAALGRDPRRAILLGGAALALGAAGLAVGLALAGGSDGAPSCAAGGDLADLWNDGRRAALRERFTGTGRIHAADSFDRAAARIDAWTARWSEQRVEICQAHRRGEQSAQLHDLRNLCLDRGRAELTALLASFEAADADVVDRAVTAARGLGDLDDCADVAALSGRPALPDDPAARAAIDRLDVEYGRLHGLHLAGKWRDALAPARAAAAEAEELGYAPTSARLVVLQAYLEREAGEFEPARATIERAAPLAAAAHDDVEAVESWILLIGLLSSELAELDQAASLVPAAEAALARGEASPLLRIRLTSALGSLAIRQGDYPTARARLEEALGLAEASLADDDPERAQVLNRLASVESFQGDYDQAELRLRQATEVLIAAYGEDHPNLGATLHNRGSVLAQQGRLDEARDTFARALAIKEAAYGAGHPELVATRSALGVVQRQLGDFATSRATLEAALAGAEAGFGVDHPRTAAVLQNLADTLVAVGELDAARTAYERVLEIQERALGADHPETIQTHLEYADLLRVQGELDAARVQVELARDLTVRAHGPQHRLYATSIKYLADILDQAGHRELALRAYRDAVDVTERALGPAHPQSASSRLDLAQAYFGAGQLEEATNEAILARDRLRAALGADHAEVAACEYTLARIALARGLVTEAVDRYQAALAAMEASYGDDHPQLVAVLTGLASALTALDRDDEAVAAARHLARILDGGRGRYLPPMQVTESRVVVGQTLYETGADPVAGRAAVVAGRAIFAASDDRPAADLVRQLDAWLAAHP